MIGNIFHAFLILLIISVAQIRSFGETKRCLFIGNSYFSHNDLSKEFLAAWNDENSDTLLVTSYCRDGTSIIMHWRYESGELQRVIESQLWDYVIIQLPGLARPQHSTLVQTLHEVDSLLKNCRIICITIDFCNSFPEMACVNHAIDGIICNEFLNCEEKLTYVKEISDSIVRQKYRNSIQIIPFSHYRYFLYDRFSIELGSDDNFGHPSSFSQSVLARFILFHLMNKTTETNDIQTKSVRSEAIHISSFYSTFFNEKHK